MMDPAYGPGAVDELEASANLPDDISSDDLDTAFEILTEERRQFALQYLAEEGGTVSLSDVVTYLVDRESAVDRTDIAADLHHSHLPKLAAAGLVEYDPEANTVTATTAGHDAVPVVKTFVQSTE